MRFESPSIQKIGIWILLVGFVAMTIVLPLSSPPAVVAKIIVLVCILQVISLIALDTSEPVCAGYRFLIHPRSPPAR